MIKRFLLLAVLAVAQVAAAQSVVFYTDRALASNPFSGPNNVQVPSATFVSYGWVRVCNLPMVINVPCTSLATITDVFGNPISVVGGNFGQLQTDVVGRFSFGCTPGLYEIQTASTSNNNIISQYPITCPSGTSAILTTNNSFTGVNTIGNINGTEVVDGARNTTLPLALNRVNPGGGSVLYPTNRSEGAETSGMSVGTSTTLPVDLDLGMNSLVTCNMLVPGSCFTETQSSRIHGAGIGATEITGSVNDNTTSLVTTDGGSFFQFDHFTLNAPTGATYSKAVFELEGGFIPSYMDNLEIICRQIGTCAHLTTGPLTGESGGDYSIDQSWFNCVLIPGCIPFSINTPTGGKHLENISIARSAIEHPGQTIPAFSADGTTGGIFNLILDRDRFEGNNIDTVTPLANLNNVDSVNFLYPWFAPLAAGNPPWVNITGAMNMFTMLGGASFTTGGIVNGVTGRTVNGQDYIPIYVYAASGNKGVFEVSPMIFSSPGNTGLAFHFNSGNNVAGAVDVTWDDQNNPIWDWQKPSNNNLVLIDRTTGVSRIALGPGNTNTIINSGGSTASVQFNMGANSGTGGIVSGTGGGSPSQTWAVDNVGKTTQVGVAFASLPAASAGAQQYCTDCQVTTAATCSTSTPASCVCKNGGSGAFARAMPYQGQPLNWFCQ